MQVPPKFRLKTQVWWVVDVGGARCSLHLLRNVPILFSDLQMKIHCPGLHQNPPPAQRDSSHSHGGSPLVPPSDSLRLLGSAPGIPWSVAAASSLEDFRATDGPSCTPLPTLAASAFLSSFSESSVENLPLSHQEAGAAGGLWVPQETNILMEFNTIQCPFRGGAECCCSPLPSYPLGAKLKRHTLTPNNSVQPPHPSLYI